jgi:hypothetical protein
LEDLPTAEEAAFLTPETGLIDTPIRTKDNGINAQALLNGSIKPGKPVFVQGGLIAGFFKPRKVQHSGSNREGSFRTSFEATPIG